MPADDRYQINPLDGPAGMAETVRRLEQRLSVLEGGNTSGTFTSADVDGNGLVYAGTLPDGDRGFLLHSESHAWDIMRATADDGWVAPHLVFNSFDPAASKIVTSGSLVDTWGLFDGSALGRGVEVYISWTTDPGTTGEITVRASTGAETDPFVLTAGTTDGTFVRWLHGYTPGTGPLSLRLRARRTAGAGNVVLFTPQAYLQEPTACSSGGVWL